MRADQIRLTGVRAYGHHGVLEHERRDGQDFVVDVVLSVDLRPAGTTDELARTVNYAEVAADVVAVVTGEPRDLIETVAEEIAARALARPLVEAVEVTVHKPQAPVGVPFGDVEVVVRRERDVPVVVALGANLASVGRGRDADVGRGRDAGAGSGPAASPAASVAAAVHRLRRLRGLRGVRVSAPVGSAPVGGPAQPDYVNAVAVGRTRLTPATLLAALHGIEADFGRTREVRWGARTLDLDLVQYGDPAAGTDVRSDDPDLLLPHPRAHERAFVLRPWLDVDPGASLRVGDEVVAVRDLIPLVADQDVHPLEEDDR